MVKKPKKKVEKEVSKEESPVVAEAINIVSEEKCITEKVQQNIKPSNDGLNSGTVN